MGVEQVVVLWSTVAIATSSERDTLEPREVQVVRGLLAIAENQIDIGRSALLLSAMVDTDTDVNAGVAMIDEITKLVQRRLNGRTDPLARIVAINMVMKEQQFQYDKTDMMGRNVRNKILWGLLTRRKGNCVMLPTLWYAIGQRLGYPLHAVLAPQHVFVRYDDGTFRQNVEVTSGGGKFTDQQLIEELEIPEQAIQSGSMMRSLSRREFLIDLVIETALLMRKAKNYTVALSLLQLAADQDRTSMSANANLAFAYTDLAAITMATKALPGKEGKQREIATKYSELAVQHARRATALGATPPLEDGYWQKVLRVTSHESGSLKLKPQPFKIESLLQPGGFPITVEVKTEFPRELIDPYFGTTAYSGRDDCSIRCGPAPGNLCAVGDWANGRQPYPPPDRGPPSAAPLPHAGMPAQMYGAADPYQGYQGGPPGPLGSRRYGPAAYGVPGTGLGPPPVYGPGGMQVPGHGAWSPAEAPYNLGVVPR